MQKKERIVRILRIIMPIVGIISAIVIAPLDLVPPLIAPLPDTVQEQVDDAVGQGLDGIIVYVDQAGESPEFYAAGWKNKLTQEPADPHALFKIGSIHKLYIATAVAKLVNNGSLSLDETLADYLPELSGRIEYADQITLRMMVQHRSGIPNFTDHVEFDWFTPQTGEIDDLERVLDEPADFEPDARYSYSNTNYLLIGRILDKVLGYSHHQYVYSQILAPLGLTDTYFTLDEVEYDQYGGPTTMTTAQGGDAMVQYDPVTFMPLSASDDIGSLGGYTWTPQGNPETYTDQYGETTDYTYTAQGYVETKTDPLEHVTHYAYDEFGRVTDVTIAYQTADASTTHYAYDELGRMTESTVAYGTDRAATTKYEYDKNGNRTKVTDPLNRVTKYDYDNANRLTLVTYAYSTAEASSTKYVYDFHGRLTDTIIAFGTADESTTHYVYDALGRKTDVTIAYGTPNASTVYYTYYSDGRVMDMTIAHGTLDASTTHYVYDAAGRTVNVTIAYGTAYQSITHYDYYDSGLLESTKTAYGTPFEAVTSYFYDSRGRPTYTLYPDGTTATQYYDTAPAGPGWTNATVDQGGVRTNYVYDAAGRLAELDVSAVDNDLEQTFHHISNYEYDAANRLINSFDPLNNRTSFTYFPTGQMHTSTSWLDATTGYTTTYDYNLAGEQISVIDANSHETEYQYNERGLLDTTIYPGGVTTSQTYDFAGRMVTSTDENGIVTKSTFNPAGQLAAVTMAFGTADATTIQYGYNYAGQLTSITDALSRVTSFEYNAAGQQEKKTWPNLSFEVFDYNAAGDMTSHTLADGNTNIYTYDNMNRLEQISYFDGQYANFTYTASGQRDTAYTRTSGPAIPQVTDYDYDPFQRLKQVTGPDGRVVSYTYYDNDLRESMTTPAGTTSYGYDALNRLTSVGFGSTQTTYEYDPVGFLTDIHRPNGVDTVITPNVRNQVDLITHSNGTTLQVFDYLLDNAGNRKRVTELGGAYITWDYDSLYRLTDEKRFTSGGGQTDHTHFAYDAAGNQDYVTVGTTTTDYTYNDLDQLISAGTVTYDYDDRGNLYQVIDGSQTTTYNYDAADRLASVTLPDTTSIAYVYDADGQRVRQTVGADVTNYLWDGASAYGDVVLETNGTGGMVASYVLGGTGLVSQTQGGATKYFLQDGQGNTRGLTDSSGGLSDSYSYTAFGELFQSSASGTNYLYTGQQFDSLTGLYSLRARYYNPAQGRFLSQDTYPYNFGNPIELNRYGYTANNPINLIDPTGNFALTEYAITQAKRGAAVGALYGIGQTLACGGNFFVNVIFGGLAGAGFGVAYAYLPGLTLGGGTLLGIQGALGAVQNAEVNGIGTCNVFTAVTSMLMVALSAGSLSKFSSPNEAIGMLTDESLPNWRAGMPGKPDVVKAADDPVQASWFRKMWGSSTSRNSPANFTDMVIRLFNGDVERFNNFLNTLNTQLPEGTTVYIRGSAVNGYKWVTGRPFDGGNIPSDIDLVLTGDNAFNLWSNGGTRYFGSQTPFASSEVPKSQSSAPALYDLIIALETQSGRGVNFVGMTEALFKFRTLVQGYPYYILVEK